MSDKPKVVAINGSPHEGIGNTALMIGLLGSSLAEAGLELEQVFLSSRDIKYCTGCGMCLDKGVCWLRDDYKEVARKIFEADAVILGSPVYVFNVTAQMKTFLDRSLGHGHRPQENWKPGLAVTVSAGMGETWAAQYLSNTLRIFGAFPVGQLTAIAVGPGEFLGKEAVEARAAELAGSLATAVREKRRYPATDQDLLFWRFMGWLVNENQSLMAADHRHWEKKGLYESFEKYVGQTRTVSSWNNPEMRKAWFKSLTSREQASDAKKPKTEKKAAPMERPSTLRALLESMPAALNKDKSAGLNVVYQFEVSGEEQFVGHLRISGGEAAFSDGPAEAPDVVIRTPAEVWLAVSQGRLDGAQAFMSGQYRVEGDASLLMKLKSLFSG